MAQYNFKKITVVPTSAVCSYLYSFVAGLIILVSVTLFLQVSVWAIIYNIVICFYYE